MAESEGDLAGETHSVQRVWEQICDVLHSIPGSVDKSTKQNVDRVMSPQVPNVQVQGNLL